MNSSGIYKSIVDPKLKYRIPKSILNLHDVDYKSYREYLFPPTVHLNIKKLFQDDPHMMITYPNLEVKFRQLLTRKDPHTLNALLCLYADFVKVNIININ